MGRKVGSKMEGKRTRWVGGDDLGDVLRESGLAVEGREREWAEGMVRRKYKVVGVV